MYTQEKAPKKMTDKFSRLKISLLNSKNLAAKEKLEIVSGAAPPPFRIFAGRLPRRLRRRESSPARIRKGGGAARIKTAKEPLKNIGSNHIL